MSDQNDRVKVAVRLRPLNQRELLSPYPKPAWEATSSSSTVSQISLEPSSSSRYQNFRYDVVFDEAASNTDVYSSLAAPIISAAISGYNTTLLAYGQTCSGKTHSMLGSSSDPGLTPLSISQVFRELPRDEQPVKASYLEIYNDRLRDLLSPSTKKKLTIRDNDTSSVSVLGATEVPVGSSKDALRLLSAGQLTRRTSDTAMNARSSRSHTIFILRFSSGNALHLVDLAGSERAKGTKASGTRLKEGAYINQSLLTLGTIISRLSSGEKKGHLPYRDSKLTRLLRPALGGDSRTAILCTITPSPIFSDETLSTLKFARRANGIVNGPVLKKVEAPIDYRSKYQEVQVEVDELRSKFHEIQEEVEHLRKTQVPSPIIIEPTSPVTTSPDSMSLWSSEEEDNNDDEIEDFLQSEDEKVRLYDKKHEVNAEEFEILQNKMANVERENVKLRQRLLKMTVKFTMLRMGTGGLNDTVRKRSRSKPHTGVHIRNNMHDAVLDLETPTLSMNSDSEGECEEGIEMKSTEQSYLRPVVEDVQVRNADFDITSMAPIVSDQVIVPQDPLSSPSVSKVMKSSSEKANVEITNVAIIQRITLDSSAIPITTAATTTMDPGIGGATALALALGDVFTRSKQSRESKKNNSLKSASDSRVSGPNQVFSTVVDNFVSIFRNIFSGFNRNNR